MSTLKQWVEAILQEDGDKVSLGTIRTLQTIKHEYERLQKENAAWAEECERLHKIAEFWQKQFNELNPGFQIPKIDNL